AGAAIIGQVDAGAQSSVQQQLAAASQKATAIESNLLASWHCLIPEGFKFHLRLVRVTAVAALPGMLRRATSLICNTHPHRWAGETPTFSIFRHFAIPHRESTPNTRRNENLKSIVG